MDHRFELALGNFERALVRFEEVLLEDETEFIRDSLIKRFEFTFESAWKACYRWLRARRIDIAEEAFQVLPRAFQSGLIADEETWSKVRKARNKTSHTYEESVAIEVSACARAVAAPAFRELLATLKARAEE